MRGFWLECRRVLAMPGLPMGPLAVGVVAGVDAHEGLPLDILAGPVTAAFVLVIAVLTLVLMRKIRWVRRRLDKRSS